MGFQTEPTKALKPVLKVTNLTKRYGKVTTVDNVEIEAYPGEIIGLLGSNGAGKTTSFHMICGLIPPTDGKIVLNGQDVTRWPMHRRCKEGLAYLPQERSTFGSLTVEENIYAAMEVMGYSKREQLELCDKLLRRFELIEHRKRLVGLGGVTGGLSGGERRRLEVARALVLKPKVLMLDEPFAACDPETINKIQNAVVDIANDGIAVVINDHSITNTLKITQRVYVIRSGKVLFTGAPLDALCDPPSIHYYFDHEAADNAATIAKAHGLDPVEARARVERANEERFRRWPDDRLRVRRPSNADAQIDEPQMEEPRRQPEESVKRPSVLRRRTPENSPRVTPRQFIRPSSDFDQETAAYGVNNEPFIQDERYHADESTRPREHDGYVPPTNRRRLTLNRRPQSTTQMNNDPPPKYEPEENRYDDRVRGIFSLKQRRKK